MNVGNEEEHDRGEEEIREPGDDSKHNVLNV